MPERHELKNQFSEAQAAWLHLRVEAEAELQALSDVNREAYDVVEMIYADFRDPGYGLGDWNLYPFYATMSRAELTIRNCRRAHDLNMERVRLKNEINRKAGAQQEVKSW